jgi:hypothetical protein
LRLESGASHSDPLAVAACDGVHITAMGHRLVAALLLQLVGEAIAKGPPRAPSGAAADVAARDAAIASAARRSARPKGKAQRASAGRANGVAEVPEAALASTPPLFNTLSELAEFSPVPAVLRAYFLVDSFSFFHLKFCLALPSSR